MRSVGIIRVFNTPNFRVIVDAIPEDSPVDVDDDGETAAKVDSGEWVHFIARARVFFKGAEIASDYLGSCIYESIEAFEDHRECGAYNRELSAKGERGRCGSYFADMIGEVITEARQQLRAMQSVRVRTN